MKEQRMKVLIGGGSGLIGSRLQSFLKTRNIDYAILSRTPEKYSGTESYYWDTKGMEIDSDAFNDVTHVINLAGAGIADKKWSDKRKKIIISSRIGTTKLLGDAIEENGSDVTTYISASATGYYGDTKKEIVNESSPPGSGFLAESVKRWEKSVDMHIPDSLRIVKLRTGVVLTTKGGPLGKMLPGLKLGIVPYFGNGKQMMSWIHIDDMVRMYVHAIENIEWEGIINGVAPERIDSKEFAQKVKEERNAFFPVVSVPEFALRLGLGEMANVVLNSSNVHNKKAQDLDFSYIFPRLEKALSDVFERNI